MNFSVCQHFIFWENSFKINEVDSFIQSHSNYRIGIPGKVALSKNIKVFNLNIDDLYRLNKKQRYVGLQFLNYKKIFNGLKKKELLPSQKKMNIRFKGGEGFEIPHTFKHAFKDIKRNNISHMFSSNKKIY